MLNFLSPVPSLPDPSGPHQVGSVEYEIPASSITSSTAVPDSNITTIKFRVFYPTQGNATGKSPLYWLPEPQSQWVQAYASFMGASPRTSSLLSHLPALLKYTTISAVVNASILPPSADRYPVVVFSHGLGGNFHTYSSVCTSLASHGIVVFAPEHRDGSSPISFIRSSPAETKCSIPYQKLPHTPDSKTLNVRNSQLRIRLWELELLYTVIEGLNKGEAFPSFVSSQSDAANLDLKSILDLAPGHVAWMGHSFGAAATVQFVKSVYYHQHTPNPPLEETDWDWTPLYTPAKNSSLMQQITPSSPMALLDLWTMPLRGEVTQWLWEKPLPCYDLVNSDNNQTSNDTPSVVAIISAEFYGYTDLMNRTRALLSAQPVEAMAKFDQEKKDRESQANAEKGEEQVKTSSILPHRNSTTASKQDTETEPPTILTPPPESSSSPSASRSPSATPSIISSSSNPRSSQSSLLSTPSISSSIPQPTLHLIPQSAHLSQSDFGALFPRLTRWAMGAIDAEGILRENVRLILEVVPGVNQGKEADGKGAGEGRVEGRARTVPLAGIVKDVKDL